MVYALIDGTGRVHAVQSMEEGDTWMYPDGFSLVEADGEDFASGYELADYVYVDGEFKIVEPSSKSVTFEDLIEDKVNAAVAKSEAKMMAKLNRASM